jgi:hypothetical protein
MHRAMSSFGARSSHLSPNDPRTLIIHGTKDFLFRIQQAELFLDELKAAGVETKPVVKQRARATPYRVLNSTRRFGGYPNHTNSDVGIRYCVPRTRFSEASQV